MITKTNAGVEILITTIVEKTLIEQINRNLKVLESLKSTISMSFENRFRIRPNGVMSKNVIGARSTLYNNGA
jgi:hypothetical protein